MFRSYKDYLDKGKVQYVYNIAGDNAAKCWLILKY